MIDPVLLKAEEKMKTSVDVLKREVAGVRTGRASPALVEHVRVDYNGVPTPLSHVASISASGNNLLIIQPWDPNIVNASTRRLGL